MNSNQFDINKQIKEKFLLFKEIDLNAKPDVDKNKISEKVNNYSSDVFDKINSYKERESKQDNDIRDNCLLDKNKLNVYNKHNLLCNKTMGETDDRQKKETIRTLKESGFEAYDKLNTNKFISNNSIELNKKNYKKLNLGENKINVKKNNENKVFINKSKSKSKPKNEIDSPIKYSKLIQKSDNKDPKKNKLSNYSASPIRSNLKKKSKEKVNIEDFGQINDNKFVPVNDQNNINFEFFQKNKSIIFNDIENKILSSHFTNKQKNNKNNNVKRETVSNTLILENEFNQKIDSKKISFSNLENIDKTNLTNLILNNNETPIREIKSPNFSSSFLNEGDGINNIMLNKDKNLNIVNLDKLYQGSFNKEFCELYSQNNIIENESTINKTAKPKNANNTNFNSISKNELKNSNININSSISLNKINKAFISNNNLENQIEIKDGKIGTPDVPIQQLNKFFTKRSNYNNLNYFSNTKKSEFHRSKESYSLNDNNKNILSKAHNKTSLNSNLIPAYNSNNFDYSNKMQYNTINVEKRKNENFINSNRFNKDNCLISKLEGEINDDINDHNNLNNILNEINSNFDNHKINNNFNSICNYVEYNNPINNKNDGENVYVEKLSNFHFIYKNKLEKIRKEENEKRYKSANPQITKKAQKIVREGYLFHCRLYPYHKIPKNSSIIKQNSNVRNTYYNHTGNNINTNNIYYYNSINNSTSASYVIENLRRLEGIEDIKTYKIYRTNKNQEIINLSNYDNDKYTNKSLDGSHSYITRSENNNFSIIRSKINAHSLNNSAINYSSTNNIKNNNLNNSIASQNSIKLNKSLTTPNSTNNTDQNFSFKPKLNNKSLNIAKNLTPSYIRLTETKKKKMSENIQIIIKNDENINLNQNLSYDSILLAKDLAKNLDNFPKARSYSKREKDRILDLYKIGIEKSKKKEALHIQKMITDEEAYKQFSFKPKINERIPPMFLATNAYKTENFANPNNEISNIHNINYGIYLKRSQDKLYNRNLKLNKKNNDNSKFSASDDNNKDKRSFYSTNNQTVSNYYSQYLQDQLLSNKSENNSRKSNNECENQQKIPNIGKNNMNSLRNHSTSFYEKNLYWKQSLIKKFNKLRDDKEVELKITHTFTPQLNKTRVATDEKFIEKNINQIQKYVNERRSFLQKSCEDLSYKKCKYSHGENFKIKTTFPQEFNLSYKNSLEKTVAKSSINALRKKEEIENGNLSDNKNSDKSKMNSSQLMNSQSQQLNLAKKNHRKIDVQNLRNNLKINEFFEYHEIILPDSNKQGPILNKSELNVNNNKSQFENITNPTNLSLNNDVLGEITVNKYLNDENKIYNNEEKSNSNIISNKHELAFQNNFKNFEEIKNLVNNNCEVNNSEQNHNMPKDNLFNENNLNHFNNLDLNSLNIDNNSKMQKNLQNQII